MSWTKVDPEFRVITSVLRQLQSEGVLVTKRTVLRRLKAHPALSAVATLHGEPTAQTYADLVTEQNVGSHLKAMEVAFLAGGKDPYAESGSPGALAKGPLPTIAPDPRGCGRTIEIDLDEL